MTFEEYKEYYLTKGVLPFDSSIRKNRLNDVQLKRKYDKYIEKSKGKTYTEDTDWKEFKEGKDFSFCTLERKLEEEGNIDALIELRQSAGWLLDTIDPAHIFPKGGYPFLKYDEENVIPLNRFSHSCLDTMRDPISGEQIDKGQQEQFWKYIVGEERYSRLEEKVRKHGKVRFGSSKVK